jgi:NarL family two-component system response regulator LiaR
MNVPTIQVLIADDHDMVRKGLVVLLENYEDIRILGEANNGQAAVDFCRRQQPDIILMDMRMPRMDGVSAIEHIHRQFPDISIIALTSFADPETVQGAIKAGATGYLLKNISGDELAAAIRKAYNGESTLSSEAAQVLIRATTQPPTIGHDLTEREREVLALMVEGLNNREIAEQLIVSSSTVKNHVSSILGKMGTTTRTQAVALAVEHRILG